MSIRSDNWFLASWDAHIYRVTLPMRNCSRWCMDQSGGSRHGASDRVPRRPPKVASDVNRDHLLETSAPDAD